MSRELDRLLRGLDARRNPGVYVYALGAPGLEPGALHAVATVREREGLTLVLEESQAHAAGLEVRQRAAWITLDVASQLDDVGLTAAVAGALAAAGIACNVIAGVHHDHLFVPVDSADAALAVLAALQADAAARG